MTLQHIETARAPLGVRTLRMFQRNPAVVLIYALILILVIVASILSPTFRDSANLIDVLRQSTALGLVAIGQLVVVVGGGIDMSVGMVARVVGLSVAVIMGATNMHPMLVLVIGLALGAVLGFLNGYLISRLGAQPFILTLGMMTVLYGVSLAVSSGPTAVVPDSVIMIYDARIGNVPAAVFVMIAIWLVAWWMMSRSKFGRNVYTVGGSQTVAKLAGINVNRVMIGTYMIAGVCAAAAGIFLLARSGVGNPNMAEGLEFQSIVAVAIGGASLYGGKGNVAGALGAVLLISIISNLFDLFQISAYIQDLFLGIIVVLAVALYRSEKSR